MPSKAISLIPDSIVHDPTLGDVHLADGLGIVNAFVNHGIMAVVF